jgi:hypothetical protein
MSVPPVPKVVSRLPLEFSRATRMRYALRGAPPGALAGQSADEDLPVERRLTGGWNESAYLLSRPDGSRAVLKWRASEPERLLGARERVEVARARGWPAPAWLAAGRAPAGGAWVVQEFIDGRTPPRLDDFVAEQMTGILGLQAGLFPGADGGWGQWAAGVVFEDWDGLRDRVRSGVPGGRRIVAAVDAIAGACPPGPLSGQDLVHGNFNLANTIAAAGRLWVVDVEAWVPGRVAAAKQPAWSREWYGPWNRPWLSPAPDRDR